MQYRLQAYLFSCSHVKEWGQVQKQTHKNQILLSSISSWNFNFVLVHDISSHEISSSIQSACDFKNQFNRTHYTNVVVRGKLQALQISFTRKVFFLNLPVLFQQQQYYPTASDLLLLFILYIISMHTILCKYPADYLLVFLCVSIYNIIIY